jgi:spore coat polysaccharide biosynthesis protein SpsF
MAVAACALFDSTGADYAALSDLPLGAGVEVIGTSALLEADRSETDSYEKEHVTPFLYRGRTASGSFDPRPLTGIVAPISG